MNEAGSAMADWTERWWIDEEDNESVRRMSDTGWNGGKKKEIKEKINIILTRGGIENIIWF